MGRENGREKGIRGRGIGEDKKERRKKKREGMNRKKREKKKKKRRKEKIVKRKQGHAHYLPAGTSAIPCLK